MKTLEKLVSIVAATISELDMQELIELSDESGVKPNVISRIIDYYSHDENSIEKIIQKSFVKAISLSDFCALADCIGLSINPNIRNQGE